MARQFDFVGKSGSVYRYTALEEERILPTAGANYVIAQLGEGGEARLVYAGETESAMSADLPGRLEEARRAFAGVELLLRLNVRRAVREAERDDLVAQHLPALNDPPPAAESPHSDDPHTPAG